MARDKAVGGGALLRGQREVHPAKCNLYRPKCDLYRAQCNLYRAECDLYRGKCDVHFTRVDVHLGGVEVAPGRREGDFHPLDAEFSLADARLFPVKSPLNLHFPMPKSYYLPRIDAGIAQLLVTFDSAVTANTAALGTKYGLTTVDINRVRAAHATFQWFLDAAEVGREWMPGFIAKRDQMFTNPQTGTVPIPGGPPLPANPTYVSYTGGPVPPPSNALLDPGFFTWFTDLVQTIKKRTNYDPADGEVMGIEGSDIPEPQQSVVPVVTGDLFHSGQPELTCKKGVFQGYTVWLTRPGQVKKKIGFSSARRYTVEEPLPATGVAEMWTFEVQYRYQNAAFGQVSQPLLLTVRG